MNIGKTINLKSLQTKNWNRKTTLKWKRKSDIEKLIFTVANWCMRKLKSDEKLPKLWIDWKNNPKCFGEYCYTDNNITVYPKIHETVNDIIDTVIHEWVHFLQDNSEIIENRERYKYYKSKNPSELEAIKLAKKYTKVCFKDIYKDGRLHLIS